MQPPRGAIGGDSDAALRRAPRFTARERQVLALRAVGRPVAEIASDLVVEPRTVRFHLANPYAKLGVTHRSASARQVALMAAIPADVATRALPTVEGESPGSGRAGLFRTDRKLTDVLRRGRFTLSAEVTPPRNGWEQAAILDQVAHLIGAGAGFLAVTKGAGGRLRGGSLPVAQTIKEQFGVPAVAHFTCRDLVPEEVENQLIDHHYFGIRNILALRGDPPDGQPGWRPRPGGYRYAYELVEQISALNAGRYLLRPSGPTATCQVPTDFCIGVAAYPEHPDAEEGLRFFGRKVEAGAHFAISQMVFDSEVYARFLDRCERAGLDVPVLPGTRLLRSRVQARHTAEKYGVTVPDRLRRRLRRLHDPDATQRALDAFLDLVERLRAYGAPGIHLFVTDTATAGDLLRRLIPSCK